MILNNFVKDLWSAHCLYAEAFFQIWILSFLFILDVLLID